MGRNIVLKTHELTVVTTRSDSPADRAQTLFEEARIAASEHVSLLVDALMVVGKFSEQIAEGGDIYPVGIRDLARKMADDAIWCAQTCSSIQKNTSPAVTRQKFQPRAIEGGGEQDEALGEPMEILCEADLDLDPIALDAAVG